MGLDEGGHIPAKRSKGGRQRQLSTMQDAGGDKLVSSGRSMHTAAHRCALAALVARAACAACALAAIGVCLAVLNTAGIRVELAAPGAVVAPSRRAQLTRAAASSVHRAVVDVTLEGDTAWVMFAQSSKASVRIAGLVCAAASQAPKHYLGGGANSKRDAS